MQGLRSLKEGGLRLAGAPAKAQGRDGVGLMDRLRAVVDLRSTGLGLALLALIGVTLALLPWPEEPGERSPVAEVPREQATPDAAAQIADLRRELAQAARERGALRAAVDALAGSLAKVEDRMQAAVPVSLARSGAPAQDPAEAQAGPSAAGTEAATPAAPAVAQEIGAPAGPDTRAGEKVATAGAEIAGPAVAESDDHPGGQGAPAPAPDRKGAAPPLLVVSKGDTLWSIATRHRVSVPDLARANDLDPSKPLYPGRRLKLPESAPAAEPSGAGPSWYTVRRGDSLTSIGRRFDVPVETLTRWNDLSAPDALRPGQRLLVARVADES
jgi:LysM repeat protein